jgi:hypothetical protein
MTKYSHLVAPESDRLLATEVGRTTRWETSYCPTGDEHFDGQRRVTDLSVRVNHDRDDEQMIWTWGGECLVHESLVAEFRAHGFSGFQLKPATVRFREGRISRSYQEIVVVGWAGIAPPESGIHVVRQCPKCHWKAYSNLIDGEHLVDWSQWTGEDFFMVWPLPTFILITERVTNFLRRERVKSYSLKALYRTRDGFSVPRLSSFLPNDLARKYGKPLGLESARVWTGEKAKNSGDEGAPS